VLIFALFFIIVILIINFEIVPAECHAELYEYTNTTHAYLVYTLTTLP